MKARFMVAVLSLLCIFLGWRLAARPSVQQETLTLNNRPLVLGDSDINLLRQDLRSQKQKLIAQNLPMTEPEAVKLMVSAERRFSASSKEIRVRVEFS